MPWNIFRFPSKWWCWCFLVSPSLSSQGSQLVSSQFNSWTGNWIENFAHLYSASDLNLEIHSLLLSFAGWSGDPALIELATHWAPLLSIDGVLVYPKETVVVCCFVCAVKKEIQEAVMPSRHIGQLAVSRSSQTTNARFSSSRRNTKPKLQEIPTPKFKKCKLYDSTNTKIEYKFKAHWPIGGEPLQSDN